MITFTKKLFSEHFGDERCRTIFAILYLMLLIVLFTFACVKIQKNQNCDSNYKTYFLILFVSIPISVTVSHGGETLEFKPDKVG